MSTNNYILNLLNIKDKNIFISEKNWNENIKGINYKIIEGVLSYNPKCCPNCGCINNGYENIIKWGFRRNCKIKIPNISNKKSLLILHKKGLNVNTVIKLLLLRLTLLIEIKIFRIILNFKSN